MARKEFVVDVVLFELECYKSLMVDQYLGFKVAEERRRKFPVIPIQKKDIYL